MAIENIEQMTQPLSEEKKVASGPDPSDLSGWYEMFYDLQDKGEVPRDWKFEDFMDNLDALDISPTDFTKKETKQPEGIMQMASAEENIVDAAIVWAADLPEFGSIEAVISSLRDGSTDYNSLINMYLDFRFGKMN